MVKIWIDKDLGKIKVLTDSESIIGLFKVTTEEKTYSPWMKKWVMSKVTHKIYDNTRAKIGKSGTVELIFGLGWAAYLVNSLRPYVPELELNQVLSGAVFSENPRLVPFKELRDYQNEDVLHVLKFKVGLFSCYTSYGKIFASSGKNGEGCDANTVLTSEIKDSPVVQSIGSETVTQNIIFPRVSDTRSDSENICRPIEKQESIELGDKKPLG